MYSLFSSIFGALLGGKKEKPQSKDDANTKPPSSSPSPNSIATNASIKPYPLSDFKIIETKDGVMQYAKDIYEIDDQEKLKQIQEKANKAIDILYSNEKRRLFVEQCDKRSGEFVIDELDKVNSSSFFVNYNHRESRQQSKTFMKDLLTDYESDLNQLKSDIYDQNRKKYFEFIPVFTGQGKHQFNEYGQDSTDSSIFAGFVYDYAFDLVGRGNISEHKNNNYQEGYLPKEVDKSKEFEDLSRRYCQKVADHYGVDIKDIPQNFRELMTTDKIFKVIEKQEQEKQQAIDKRNDTQAYGPYLNLENNISHDNEIKSKPHLNKGVAYQDLENKYNQAFQSQEIQDSIELQKLKQLLNKSGSVVKTFKDFREVKKKYKDLEGTPIEEAIFSLFVKIEGSKKEIDKTRSLESQNTVDQNNQVDQGRSEGLNSDTKVSLNTDDLFGSVIALDDSDKLTSGKSAQDLHSISKTSAPKPTQQSYDEILDNQNYQNLYNSNSGFFQDLFLSDHNQKPSIDNIKKKYQSFHRKLTNGSDFSSESEAIKSINQSGSNIQELFLYALSRKFNIVQGYLETKGSSLVELKRDFTAIEKKDSSNFDLPSSGDGYVPSPSPRTPSPPPPSSSSSPSSSPSSSSPSPSSSSPLPISETDYSPQGYVDFRRFRPMAVKSTPIVLSEETTKTISSFAEAMKVSEVFRNFCRTKHEIDVQGGSFSKPREDQYYQGLAENLFYKVSYKENEKDKTFLKLMAEKEIQDHKKTMEELKLTTGLVRSIYLGTAQLSEFKQEAQDKKTLYSFEGDCNLLFGDYHFEHFRRWTQGTKNLEIIKTAKEELQESSGRKLIDEIYSKEGFKKTLEILEYIREKNQKIAELDQSQSTRPQPKSPNEIREEQRLYQEQKKILVNSYFADFDRSIHKITTPLGLENSRDKYRAFSSDNHENLAKKKSTVDHFKRCYQKTLEIETSKRANEAKILRSYLNKRYYGLTNCDLSDKNPIVYLSELSENLGQEMVKKTPSIRSPYHALSHAGSNVESPDRSIFASRIASAEKLPALKSESDKIIGEEIPASYFWEAKAYLEKGNIQDLNKAIQGYLKYNSQGIGKDKLESQKVLIKALFKSITDTNTKQSLNEEKKLANANLIKYILEKNPSLEGGILKEYNGTRDIKKEIQKKEFESDKITGEDIPASYFWGAKNYLEKGDIKELNEAIKGFIECNNKQIGGDKLESQKVLIKALFKSITDTNTKQSLNEEKKSANANLIKYILKKNPSLKDEILKEYNGTRDIKEEIEKKELKSWDKEYFYRGCELNKPDPSPPLSPPLSPPISLLLEQRLDKNDLLANIVECLSSPFSPESDNGKQNKDRQSKDQNPLDIFKKSLGLFNERQ